MKYTLSSIIAFTVGAAVGSAVTWKLLKTKYERLAQEEINSVKEVFCVKKSDVEEQAVKTETEPKADLDEKKTYSNLVRELDYQNSEEREEEDVSRPYVIAPEQLGEIDGYETISLIYYADEKLADDNDELVDNVDEIIGYDSLTHFGDYEDDSVCVRNDSLKVDYEILLSLKDYSEVLDDRMRLEED